MTSSDVWSEQTAATYDEDSAEYFAPEVLGPTVDVLARLAGDGPALELAVGTGRVALPLAARGVPVSGIELSEPMAARLRHKDPHGRVPVVLGDMATTVVDGVGTHSLVYLVWNSISNLRTQAEQVRCFRNAARHLRPGGRFVIDLWVPPLQRMTPGHEAVPMEVGPDQLVFDTCDVVARSAPRTTTERAQTAPSTTASGASATSGRWSATSWPSWPGSSSSRAGPTGPARRSPRRARLMCRSGASPEAGVVRMALRAAVVGRYVAPSTDASRRGGARQAWLGCRQGFTSNITNPTVLPQFLPAGGSALQAVPLALVHAVVSAAYLALVTLGADRARRVLQRRRVRRAVDALTGTAMLGFGISLASEQV